MLCYLATSTRIGRADISDKFNTVLTFFQTSDISYWKLADLLFTAI
jgi:hypothetical protein